MLPTEFNVIVPSEAIATFPPPPMLPMLVAAVPVALMFVSDVMFTTGAPAFKPSNCTNVTPGEPAAPSVKLIAKSLRLTNLFSKYAFVSVGFGVEAPEPNGMHRFGIEYLLRPYLQVTFYAHGLQRFL